MPIRAGCSTALPHLPHVLTCFVVVDRFIHKYLPPFEVPIDLLGEPQPIGRPLALKLIVTLPHGPHEAANNIDRLGEMEIDLDERELHFVNPHSPRRLVDETVLDAMHRQIAGRGLEVDDQNRTSIENLLACRGKLKSFQKISRQWKIAPFESTAFHLTLRILTQSLISRRTVSPVPQLADSLRSGRRERPGIVFDRPDLALLQFSFAGALFGDFAAGVRVMRSELATFLSLQLRPFKQAIQKDLS